jgi:ubiquinone/menaquinone biosynthesis C-methylase UbiE
MLAYARSSSPSVEFVRGNAIELPFPDGSFDAAIVAFLLLHVGRPEEVVAEAARVVAPGGRDAFSVWDEPSRGRWLGVVFDAFTAAGARRRPTCRPARRSFGSQTSTSSPGW